MWSRLMCKHPCLSVFIFKEALGSTRRHTITTQGYKEDLKEETSSLSVIERARRVNKSGTVESRITNDVKAGLNGWSSMLECSRLLWDNDIDCIDRCLDTTRA